MSLTFYEGAIGDKRAIPTVIFILFLTMVRAHHYYYTLEDAERQKRDDERIWARTRIKMTGNHTMKFTCATPFGFLESFNDDPCDRLWYERISPTAPCRFYLDVELGIHNSNNASPEWLKRLHYLGYDETTSLQLLDKYKEICKEKWTEVQCRKFFRFFTGRFEAFLQTQQLSRRGIVYLGDCRPSKFSIHVIHGGLLIDRNFVAGRYLAWEFSRYLWNQINVYFVNKVPIAEGSPTAWTGNQIMLLRLLMLNKQANTKGWLGMHDTPVDESVYSKGRLFRLFGCAKVDRPDQFQVQTAEVLFLAPRKVPVATLQERLFSTLIVPVGSNEEPIIFTCTNEWCPLQRKLDAAFREVYDCTQKQMQTNNRRYMRQLPSPWVEDRRIGGNIGLSRKPGRPHDPTMARTTAGRITAKMTAVIDGDRKFVCCDGVERALSEMEFGENFFHDCSAECDDVTGEPTGTPSAFLVKTRKEGSRMLFCFACESALFVTEVYEPELFSFRPDEIDTQGNPTVPGKMKDLDPFALVNRFCVVGGPCGSGKTHQMQRILRSFSEHNRAQSVSTVTNRSSLAITLGAQLELNCYLHIPKDDQTSITNMEMWKRVSVCLNSIVRIPDLLLDNYDTIILDEAGALRRHFCTEFMNQIHMQVLERLRAMLSGAKTVIVAQYQLDERDVLFFASLAGVDDVYGDAVFRYQYQPQNPPRLVYITQDRDKFLYRLFNWLKCHGQGKKVYIATASLKEANFLIPFIRDNSPAIFPFDPERIKGLTGNSQIQAWAKDFLSAPNVYIQDIDVLIATPCMQAGQSLDNNIHKVFGFYPNVLTHKEEHQQISRARPWSEMEPLELYVQPGCSGRMLACRKTQYTNELATKELECPLLCSTMADIKAEKADSANRHAYLYRVDPNYKVEDLDRSFAVSGDSEIEDLVEMYKASAETTSHTIVGHLQAVQDGTLSADNAHSAEESHAFGLSASRQMSNTTGTFGQLWQEVFGVESVAGNIGGNKFAQWRVWMCLRLPFGSNFWLRQYRDADPRLKVTRMLQSMFPKEWGNLPYGIPLDESFSGHCISPEAVRLATGTDTSKITFQNAFRHSPENLLALKNTCPIKTFLSYFGLPVEKGKRKWDGGAKVTQYKINGVTFHKYLECWKMVDKDAASILDALGADTDTEGASNPANGPGASFAPVFNVPVD